MSTQARGTPALGQEFLIPSNTSSPRIQLASLADDFKVLIALDVTRNRILTQDETDMIDFLMDDINNGSFALSNGNESELLFKKEDTAVLRVFKIKVHKEDCRIEMISHCGILLPNVLEEQQRALIQEIQQDMDAKLDSTSTSATTKPIEPISFSDLMIRIRKNYCIQGYTTTNTQRAAELKPTWEEEYKRQSLLLRTAPRQVAELRKDKEALMNNFTKQLENEGTRLENEGAFIHGRTKVELEQQRTIQMALGSRRIREEQARVRENDERMQGRLREERAHQEKMRLLEIFAKQLENEGARNKVDLERTKVELEQQRTIQLALGSGGARSNLSAHDSAAGSRGNLVYRSSSTQNLFSNRTYAANNGSGHNGLVSTAFGGTSTMNLRAAGCLFGVHQNTTTSNTARLVVVPSSVAPFAANHNTGAGDAGALFRFNQSSAPPSQHPATSHVGSTGQLSPSLNNSTNAKKDTSPMDCTVGI